MNLDLVFLTFAAFWLLTLAFYLVLAGPWR